MVRRFRMTDSVIRFITVRLDEEMRRARKRQAEMRERRGSDAVEVGGGEPRDRGEAMAEPEEPEEEAQEASSRRRGSEESGGEA